MGEGVCSMERVSQQVIMAHLSKSQTKADIAPALFLYLCCANRGGWMLE